MTRSVSAALALSLAAISLAVRADEGGGGGGDVQAHPKELTAPGTKGSKLKVNPKNSSAAAQKVDPAAVQKGEPAGAKAATEVSKEAQAAPGAAKTEAQK